MREQLTSNEQPTPFERPPLDIDLSGGDGHWFNVISMARAVMEGDTRKEFNQVVWEAMLPGSGTTYNRLLEIVDTYTDLLDTSNTFPRYGQENHVNRAVGRLNDRLLALPPHIECEIGGLYPEFEHEGIGPRAYAQLVGEETERVERELDKCGIEDVEGWRQLLGILRDCTKALNRAGFGI